MLRERNPEDLLNEIRDIIKRMDTRWRYGFFINEAAYIQQWL
jgi:hypothetical protein